MHDVWRAQASSRACRSGQGSQYSSAEFVAEVSHIGARLSMDGKGCWHDTFFVERLWRSMKYADVYLKAYDSIGATFAWVPGVNYPELSSR